MERGRGGRERRGGRELRATMLKMSGHVGGEGGIADGMRMGE